VSRADVDLVFGPIWEREVELLRELRHAAEQDVLWLRRRLIAADPSLPNEYDGNSWYELRKEEAA
jgi:hypothetical protein